MTIEKMKKFSLEEYLKNPNRKVVTRDGHSVRIICTDRDDENTPIIALVRHEGVEVVMAFSKNGEYFCMNEGPCPCDLFFAPETKTKKVGWMNVCKYGDAKHFSLVGGVIHPTREEALKGKSEYSVDTIQIKWEE
uniref:hypothetical protein n=1 Tax=Candidatus Cryptobacteroides bacterium TaxID=3085639 RepID=UPI00402503E9